MSDPIVQRGKMMNLQNNLLKKGSYKLVVVSINIKKAGEFNIQRLYPIILIN
ncbi:MAG TPA: hypothetical protein VJ964_10980 [Balneolaceae bacterium]|nr:hypothetical protein [Balneolaceae bacterium]